MYYEEFHTHVPYGARMQGYSPCVDPAECPHYDTHQSKYHHLSCNGFSHMLKCAAETDCMIEDGIWICVCHDGCILRPAAQNEERVMDTVALEFDNLFDMQHL